MDRTEQCDNFAVCGNKHIIVIPGYYHGTRLCEPCLEKRKIECCECREIIAYVSYGSTMDRISPNQMTIYCDVCIDEMKH